MAASRVLNDLVRRIQCEMGFDAAQRCSRLLYRLDFTDSCLPPNPLLSLCFSSPPSLISFLCPHLETTSIFSLYHPFSFGYPRRELSFEPCWEFAVLNYCVVINEVWAPILQSSSCWSPPERRVPYQRHCCSLTSVSSSAVVSLHLQLHIYESLIETDSLIFQPNCPGIWQNGHQRGKETEKTKWKRMRGRGETEKVTPDLQSHAEKPRDDKTISLRRVTVIDLIRSTHPPPPPPFILTLASHILLLLFTDSNMMNRSRGEMSNWPSLDGAREHIWQNQIRSVKDEACQSPYGAANGINTAQMTRILYISR